MHKDGKSDSRQLEEVEASRQVSESSGKSDVGDGSMANQRGGERGRTCGFEGPERKSTSGRMMMINGTVVKHWSRMQATRALNTAEAEYYAFVMGAAEGLGMQSMMADLGLSAQVRVWTDSTLPRRQHREEVSVRLDTWN